MEEFYCLSIDEDGAMEERFFDNFHDAWERARGCHASGFVYYWGETRNSISWEAQS